MGKSALRNKKKTFTASATKISRATNEIAIALTLQQSARTENPQRFSPSAGSTEFLKAIEDLGLAPPWKRRACVQLSGVRRLWEPLVRASTFQKAIPSSSCARLFCPSRKLPVNSKFPRNILNSWV